MAGALGPKQKNPLKRHFPRFSYVMLAVCVLVAVFSRVYVSYGFAQGKDEAVPVLAANSWIGDLRAYHSMHGGFPPTLVELERDIWIPRRTGGRPDPNSPQISSLENPHVYTKNNYVYIYWIADNPHVCSLWCVPIGEDRTKANTVFVIITADNYEQWRGAALSEEMFQYIPRHAIPTQLEMSRLGMYKQDKKPGGVQKRSGGLMGALDSMFDSIFGSSK